MTILCLGYFRHDCLGHEPKDLRSRCARHRRVQSSICIESRFPQLNDISSAYATAKNYKLDSSQRMKSNVMRAEVVGACRTVRQSLGSAKKTGPENEMTAMRSDA